MKLHRRQTFAGFLIVGLISLVGFAAFSATGFRTAPPVDLPADVSARIAGQLLGVDLGPDSGEPTTTTPTPATTAPDSDGIDDSAAPAEMTLVTAFSASAGLGTG